MTDDELRHHAAHALSLLSRVQAVLQRIEAGGGTPALLTSVDGHLDGLQSILDTMRTEPTTKALGPRL